jgi:hypothetical protein
MQIPSTVLAYLLCVPLHFLNFCLKLSAFHWTCNAKLISIVQKRRFYVCIWCFYISRLFWLIVNGTISSHTRRWAPFAPDSSHRPTAWHQRRQRHPWLPLCWLGCGCGGLLPLPIHVRCEQRCCHRDRAGPATPGSCNCRNVTCTSTGAPEHGRTVGPWRCVAATADGGRASWRRGGLAHEGTTRCFAVLGSRPAPMGSALCPANLLYAP